MSTPILQLQGIDKRFGSVHANRDLSLSLHPGEVLALLGENGAGKTTLMNILFGHYVADAGEIRVAGELLPPGSPAAALAAGIGMVHQHFTLADNLPVLDNILLGTEPLWRPWQGRSAARKRVLELGQEFGLAVTPDRLVGALSVGERQRVEILKALYRGARILILDEPTAVLTPQESEALFATLRRMVERGLAVIFISHKLHEVLSLADRIMVLRHGALSASFQRGEVNRRQLAAAMVGHELSAPQRGHTPPGNPVLRLEQVSAGVLQELSLSVHEHEILGIAGVAGNGQVALADLLSGLLAPQAGQCYLGNQPLPGHPAKLVAAGVGRIPEDRARGVVGELSCTENLILEDRRWFSRWGWLRRRAMGDFARELIHAFDIRTSGASAPARGLSGGNAQKLILARTLSRQPRLILAAQPTRGLDVGAMEYVHAELVRARERGAGVVLISEDLDELLGLADRVAVMFRGRLSEALPVAELNATRLGLLMSGQTLEEDPHAA